MKRRGEKLFIDTNVFVYTFEQNSPRKRARAEEIVGQALEDGMAVISYQVVQEFLNVATRKFHKPMSAAEAQIYLDRVLVPLCEIYPSADLYARALSIAATARISFYDALIVASAEAAGCRAVLSEDLQDGSGIVSIEIRNPFV